MKSMFRFVFAAFVIVALVGTGIAGYFFLNRQVTMRVAVTSLEGEDVALVASLSRWLAANGRRFRLRTVPVSDMDAAFAAIKEGKADFVSMRADMVPPPELASMAVLYKEVAFIVGVPQTGVTSFAQLKGKTIGVIDKTSTDDPLLKTLLRLHGVTDAKFLPLPLHQIQAEVQKRNVQAIAHVSPLNGTLNSELRSMRPLRRIRGEPVLLGLEDAEAQATLDRHYEAFDVPGGALRATPPLPSETISTLAVSRHLVGRRSVSSLFVGRFLAELMDARRGILSETPLAAQIGAPDTETNAVMPVHQGAAAYFDSEQLTLYEFITEWAYVILLVVGALATGLVGLTQHFWPDQKKADAQLLVMAFITLQLKAGQASSSEALHPHEVYFDELLEEMGELFEEGEIERNDVHAVLATADMAARKLAEMRKRIDRMNNSAISAA